MQAELGLVEQQHVGEHLGRKIQQRHEREQTQRPVRREVRSKLRRKLGDDAAKPAYILTERGVGYRMA